MEQSLSLMTLMQNLRTFAIGEGEDNTFLISMAHAEFKHLLSLLYDHPAVEFAADALWQHMVGSERKLPEEEATHIGPSVAMLLHLDLSKLIEELKECESETEIIPAEFMKLWETFLAASKIKGEHENKHK